MHSLQTSAMDWYGNSYYTTDRANIKIEMIDNLGGSTILQNQGYYKNLYTNPATFASKSVNNIVAAYDGYFRVTLSCSKGVAYFENLDLDIDRTETVVTNTIETDVLHSSDYYPFGLRMVKNSAPSVNYPYGYQGDFAEEDDETGFNHFEARDYDPVIGRWMNVEPNRQFWSPYNGMGNNPIIGFDPDGRDVIVLLDRSGASGFGHTALLVGSDKTGWTFVSKEGRSREAWYSSRLTGGPALQPRTQPFDRLEDFHNNADFDNYKEGIRFTTTEEQDKTAIGEVQSSASSYYHVLYNNCGNACADGLQSIGLPPGFNKDFTVPSEPSNRFDNMIWNSQFMNLDFSLFQKKTPQIIVEPAVIIGIEE